ncbi:hypothetical protein C8F04DRAFT_1032334 [Mycena alexandri]|uniref:Uncharacterized protein n=1 Tax=Mycena alexandri TaxID=1745969 RepID=A0AAD6XCU7_9AGAR|nr:hypothetical protein C8F04DRAFT_1032334 [Mycena alexandri]
MLCICATASLLAFGLYRWQKPFSDSRVEHGREIGTVKWSPPSNATPARSAVRLCACITQSPCSSAHFTRSVPKYYFDLSTGTASVAIARFKATKFPKKGTVRPGGSGTRLAAQSFADLIGEDWDLLGFDPRGINKTTPQVQCFNSSLDFNFFVANTVLQQGFTVASSTNLLNPTIEAQLFEQAREFIALKKSQAELCAKNMGDELKYMGTATVVRDMDFMILDCEDA